MHLLLLVSFARPKKQTIRQRQPTVEQTTNAHSFMPYILFDPLLADMIGQTTTVQGIVYFEVLFIYRGLGHQKPRLNDGFVEILMI